MNGCQHCEADQIKREEREKNELNFLFFTDLAHFMLAHGHIFCDEIEYSQSHVGPSNGPILCRLATADIG